MGWTQVIEYVDAEVTLPPPVKKQVWDGEKFVPMTVYKMSRMVNDQERNWLWRTYGPAGRYVNGHFWDYSVTGNFTIMDEKIHTWFQMKWGNK